MTSLSLCLRGVNAALLIGLLFGAGCAKQPSQEAGTFVIGIESAPASLDPRLAVDAYSSKICRLIYSGLFRVDASLELQPELLESYEQISPTEYRFTLRPDIQFHDGTPLAVRDVLWTYNSIRDRSVPSPHYAAFAIIDKLTALDERTFTLILKKPFSPFLMAMTMGILPEGRSDKRLGAGPFFLEEEVPDQKVVLSRNENYFRGPAQSRRLIFRVVRDDNLRVLDLVRGRIDLVQNNLPAALIPYIKKQKDLVMERAPGINYSYMGMNLDDPILKRRKVREAMAHALDRKKIIAYKLAGMARPATGILAPMHWAYVKPSAEFPYDPKRARRLLDEAGYPDPDGPGPRSRFQLIYKTSSKRDRVGLARLMAQYLQQVGIDVIVTPYEWGTLFRDIRTGNFQMYSLTWVGVTEPDIYYYTFNSSQIPPHGANRDRYINPAIDKLTDVGREISNRSERKEIYGEIQNIIASDLPYISLWYEDNVLVRQANVKGYVIHPNASFQSLANIYRDDE